jgi:hypothetical protein
MRHSVVRIVLLASTAALLGAGWLEGSDVDRAPEEVVAMADQHLAAGEAGAAAELLRVLVAADGDPRYVARLAEALREKADYDEANKWAGLARARFLDRLHEDPATYAAPAARFFAGVGNSPGRAWELALFDVSMRQTRESCELMLETSRFVGEMDRACRMRGCEELLAAACEEEPTDAGTGRVVRRVSTTDRIRG